MLIRAQEYLRNQLGNKCRHTPLNVEGWEYRMGDMKINSVEVRIGGKMKDAERLSRFAGRKISR